MSSSTCRFQRTNSIQLNNSTVIINKSMVCKETKEVYEVIFNLQDREKHILKVIYGEDSESINTIDFYMQDTNNHYFMEMIDFHKDDNKTFLLLKYYKEKTILEYIKKHNLSSYEKNKFIENILEIGCYLHQNSYLHADIKPDNFFIDSPRVRLGDLESTVKLNDIHNDTIYSLCGTKGFKYSSDESYSIKDEIFAYIATIYFIEVGELLMTKEVFTDLTKEEDSFEAINESARAFIDTIERDSIKNFLLDTLDLLEDEEQIDCCTMLEEFKLLPKEQKEIVVEEPIIEQDNGGGDHPIKKDKPKRKWLKPSILSVAIIFAVTLIYQAQKPNTPKCDQAFFIDNSTIRVLKKSGNVFYNYSANEQTFTPIVGYRVNELMDDPREKNKNGDGEVIECQDGRVHIF